MSRPLARSVARVWELLRRGDHPRLIHAFFDVVPAGLLHVDVLYVLQLGTGAAASQLATGLEVRPVTPADLAELDRRFPRPGEDGFEGRLAAGDLGLVCCDAGRIGGMAWLGLVGPRPEPAKFCSFQLPRDAAWVYDVSVATAWQGRGLGTLLFRESLDHVRSHGRARVLASVSWSNRPSLKAAHRAGYEPIQRLSVVNVLGLRVHRLRDLESRSRPATQVRLGTWARIPVAGNPSEAHTRMETAHG
jgi:GNAT superfamily N-acetyltransferase